MKHIFAKFTIQEAPLPSLILMLDFAELPSGIDLQSLHSGRTCTGVLGTAKMAVCTKMSLKGKFAQTKGLLKKMTRKTFNLAVSIAGAVRIFCSIVFVRCSVYVSVHFWILLYS
jgi:hypothetical protein